MGNQSLKHIIEVTMHYLIFLSLVPLIAGKSLIGFSRTLSTDVPLVTFDGAESTTFKFTELDDPVMGGISSGTFEVNSEDAFGIFDGTVRDVPSLSAPGAISAYAMGEFNDASMALSGDLVLKVRSSTPDYKGFRISFAAGALNPRYSCSGGGQIPFSGGCFKSTFQVPASDDFVEVRVPFSSFSDHWSPSTGDPTVTCADDPSVCPTNINLGNIQMLQVWAEGVKGDIHLEIESIIASTIETNGSKSRQAMKSRSATTNNMIDTKQIKTYNTYPNRFNLAILK